MSKALFATARVSGWRGICCQLSGSDRFPSGDDTHDHHSGQTKPKRGTGENDRFYRQFHSPARLYPYRLATAMRYSLLVLLLPFSLSLPILSVSAADSPELLSQINRSSEDFWPQAQRLVEEQLYLMTQIQRAIAGPDVNKAEAVRGQLILHSGAVERFLQSQYRLPRRLCSNSTSSNAAADLSVPQQRVYCALYASTQQLRPVVSLLEGRLPMLVGLAAPNTQPRLDEPLLSSPLNYRERVKPRYEEVPNLPVAEPPVIGLPTKTPSSEDLPFQPAIAPPVQATIALSEAREQLLSVLPAFPASARIIDPTLNAQIIDRSTYGLLPVESQAYGKLQTQPNTGVARVLSAESYRPDPNQLRNRLQPTVAERFPFVALGKSSSGLTPRFTLQIENGNFQIPLPGLDYGFMINLGEVPLENLNPTLQNIRTLSQEQRKFFLNYSPPNQLEALQVDRLRFLTGKDRAGLIPSVSLPASTQAPAILNNTYLLRLFQFQLPEVILQREPISRAQRRYLDQILETPSSDVLVAFRPINRRSDGSYTVLWRVLNQFPDPKIQDLENYVDLE
ncbi:MAG TPA: hypothetical protein V6C90_03260 [Coleofasciculaceae cyanobacterium]